MNEPNLNAAALAYGQLVSAFEQTTAPAAHPYLQSDDTLAQILIVDIAGYRARIRSTSRLLHDRLRHPLAHLEVAPDTVVPSFTVDFIDGSGLDDISLSLPVTAQQSSPEQETLEYQAGPYLFTLHGDSVLTAMNRDARRTVGIVRDPARWPLEHYQQAIFISLYQHLQARGLYLIHASAIGRNGQAILFSAKSGAGKTTTMLTCVEAGFQFYSDDATLLRLTGDGQIEVVSLLGCMNVTNKTLGWFPELAPYTSEVASRTGKRLVMIHDTFPDHVALSGIVQAIIAPEITEQAHASIAPMGKMSLLSELLPFSLDLHDTNAAKNHLEFLAKVLEQVPCYRLKLGKTRNDLPSLLDQILVSQDQECAESPSTEL